MALSATFTANFSSFYDAVAKADVKLKNFGEGADKVGARLNKMGDKFSGVKVVQDAELMIKAIGGIEGVAKLTDKELATLGATANEAAEKLRRLGREVPKDLQAIADKTKVVAKETSVLDSQWAKLTSAFAVGSLIDRGVTAVGQGFQALAQFMGDSVMAAIDAEKAQSRMVGALEAQNVALPGVIKHYDALATKYQQFTKFNDDTVREAITTLTQIGQVAPKQMDAALQATTDLASALQMELPQAAEMVSRAIEGNVGAFKKMGIVLDEAKVKAQGADYIFAAINARFGGAAQRDLTTYAGKIEALANQWDDFQEQVGDALIGTGALSGGLAATSVAVSLMSGELKGLAAAAQMLNATGSVTQALAAYYAARFAGPPPATPMSREMASSHTDVDRASADMKATRDKERADLLAAAAALKAADAAEKAEAAYQSWKRATLSLSDADRELLNHMLRLAKEGGPNLVGSLLKIDTTIESIIDRQFGSKLAGSIKDVGVEARKAADLITAMQRAATLVKPTDWNKLLGGAISGGALAGAAARDLAITDLERFNKQLNIAAGLIDVVAAKAQGGFRRVMQFVSPAAHTVVELAKAFKVAKGNLDDFASSAAVTNAGMSFAWFGLEAVINSINEGLAEHQAHLQRVAQTRQTLRKEFGLSAAEVKALIRQIQASDKVSLFANTHERLIRTLGEAKTAIDGLYDVTERFGGVVPKALRPMVESLLQMQGLPKQFHDELELLGGAPAWQKIQERADALGVDLGHLGPAFSQARVADLGFGLLHDLEMFADAGANMSGVLLGMKEELSGLAEESVKTGVVLPKSLEPYMKQLREMGLLVDENGNAIGDLSFGDLEDESLKAVVKVLEQIRELLEIAIPAAANKFQILPGTGVIDQTGSGLTGGYAGAFATVDGGGSVAPSGMPNDGMMTVIVEADGRQLSRIVAPFLPGEVRRMGLASG